MISVVLDVAGGLLLLIGLTLMTVGLYGLLRMPDTYGQLHAQGLVTGPGVLCVLASSIATENAAIITFALLAIAFVALTSPMSGHSIGRAAHRRRNGGSGGGPPRHEDSGPGGRRGRARSD